MRKRLREWKICECGSDKLVTIPTFGLGPAGAGETEDGRLLSLSMGPPQAKDTTVLVEHENDLGVLMAFGACGSCGTLRLLRVALPKPEDIEERVIRKGQNVVDAINNNPGVAKLDPEDGDEE